jgi:lipopolysaccharide/colanic/teichoic acid biosynthesis glycosyltransferase
MLPGLSGWAQVCAPYAASLEESELKLSYDLYYLRNWSTALDLLILFKTVKTLLKVGGR